MRLKPVDLVRMPFGPEAQDAGNVCVRGEVCSPHRPETVAGLVTADCYHYDWSGDDSAGQGLDDRAG